MTDFWSIHQDTGERYYINLQDTEDPPKDGWIASDSVPTLLGNPPIPEIYPLPAPPHLKISIDKITATFEWNFVEGAEGFNFCFDLAEPGDPFDGEFISCHDIGRLYGELPLDLWRGASLYIGIQAYNDYGISNYSNIELLSIPKIMSVDNDGDGYFVEDGDCNDNDPEINPGAKEIIGDGVDQNCNPNLID